MKVEVLKFKNNDGFHLNRRFWQKKANLTECHGREIVH